MCDATCHNESLKTFSLIAAVAPYKLERKFERLQIVDPATVFAFAWLLLPFLLLILWLRDRSARNHAERRIAEAEAATEELKQKYAPVTSVEDEVSTLRITATELQNQIEETRRSYSEKRATLKS